MNDLQKLALEHIAKMASELDSSAISLTNAILINKEEFNPDVHSFPLAQKAREIERWAKAILNAK